MSNKTDNSPALQNLLDGINEMANELTDSENDRRKAEDRIADLEKQLKDKYNTETHVLVEREVLEGLSEDFDELADGLGQLRDTFDTIYDYASDISNETEYHDARSFRDTAIECMYTIKDILDPKSKEEEQTNNKETV
jgi:predicted transcriptional regulator